MIRHRLSISPEVQQALAQRQAVVALETTVMTHGLPYPQNLATVQAMEAAVRAHGAIPATIGIVSGQAIIGLNSDQLSTLAHDFTVHKASRRDLGAVIAQGQSAGTTVSATMALAAIAGIRVFATGGIGGVHKRLDPRHPLDISADLFELQRTPVLVVCAGAKSLLDIPQTLEWLESLGVPVIGFQTSKFPTFTVAGSLGPTSCRVESAHEAARVLHDHVHLLSTGALLVQPLAEHLCLPAEEFAAALESAERLALEEQITGPAVTPFVLAKLAETMGERAIRANQEVLYANARLAAEVAQALIAFESK